MSGLQFAEDMLQEAKFPSEIGRTKARFEEAWWQLTLFTEDKYSTAILGENTVVLDLELHLPTTPFRHLKKGKWHNRTMGVPVQCRILDNGHM